MPNQWKISNLNDRLSLNICNSFSSFSTNCPSNHKITKSYSTFYRKNQRIHLQNTYSSHSTSIYSAAPHENKSILYASEHPPCSHTLIHAYPLQKVHFQPNRCHKKPSTFGPKTDRKDAKLDTQKCTFFRALNQEKEIFQRQCALAETDFSKKRVFSKPFWIRKKRFLCYTENFFGFNEKRFSWKTCFVR
jgi:hypothetical protein